MTGTNPLTFTMPTDEEFPFNFDCATSIVQNGKIEYYERSGKPTPAGLVVTPEGGTMTDSGDILKQMRKGPLAASARRPAASRATASTPSLKFCLLRWLVVLTPRRSAARMKTATTACTAWVTSSL